MGFVSGMSGFSGGDLVCLEKKRTMKCNSETWREKGRLGSPLPLHPGMKNAISECKRYTFILLTRKAETRKTARIGHPVHTAPSHAIL